MSSTNAELALGAVKLLSPNPPWDDYAIEAVSAGTTWGTPEAVVAAVASMLMDGAKAKITRFGNREAKIPLQIRGATMDAVAAGEAALMAEVNKGRNALSWLPPGWSTVSVFDVVYSVLDFEFDDLAETNQVTRYFTLTLICQPSARRSELSIVVAEPIPDVTPVWTTIDACTSLTGWTSNVDLSIVSGAVTADTSSPTSDVSDVADLVISRAGLAAGVAADEFIVVEIEGAWEGPPYFQVNGTARTPVAFESVSAKRARWYLRPAGTTLTNLGILVGDPAAPTVKIHDVSKVTQYPVTGTKRQRSFLAEVLGTARTAADLVVETDATIGTDAVIFTAPVDSACSPPMRPWLTTSSTPTNDATAVSGKRHGFGSASVYERPLSSIPSGVHLIVARLTNDSGADVPVPVTFTWSAATDDHPYATADTAEGDTITVGIPGDESWVFRELGVVMLPPDAVDLGTDATVKITLDTADTDTEIDDLWLFNIERGVLTWLTDINAGTGDPSKVEVRSATIDRDRPTWLVGTAGTDVDDLAVPSRATSPGVHEFSPGVMEIFLITPGTTEQTVTVEYFERFQHHVTPLGS